METRFLDLGAASDWLWVLVDVADNFNFIVGNTHPCSHIPSATFPANSESPYFGEEDFANEAETATRYIALINFFPVLIFEIGKLLTVLVCVGKWFVGKRRCYKTAIYKSPIMPVVALCALSEFNFSHNLTPYPILARRKEGTRRPS